MKYVLIHLGKGKDSVLDEFDALGYPVLCLSP
jgi:hypothetical protein